MPSVQVAAAKVGGSGGGGSSEPVAMPLHSAGDVRPADFAAAPLAFGVGASTACIHQEAADSGDPLRRQAPPLRRQAQEAKRLHKTVISLTRGERR
jgi:hypothetical protein